MYISKNPGIYIHIPFCQTKCGYCDFYSLTDTTLINTFVDSLIKEITLSAEQIQSNDSFDTIYIGGGTPSLLSVKHLDLILKTLRLQFNIIRPCEITLEVNPGTVKLLKLKEYINLGFNRISIGVQSFLDHELKIAERIHNSEEAIKTIENCRKAGFENINLDLIFSLPGQNLNDWQFSLERALSFSPEHLSVYNLSIEAGTPFHQKKIRGEISQQNEEQEAVFYETAHGYLNKKNYLHYEISNYARSLKYISNHNYKYWNHTPYLGFGPSAHSFWRLSRWANVNSVSNYVKSLSINELPQNYKEDLNQNDLIFEFIFLALRTYQGLKLDTFKKKFHKPFVDLFQNEVQDLIQNNLARINNGYFQLTDKGILICDEILPCFSIL